MDITINFLLIVCAIHFAKHSEGNKTLCPDAAMVFHIRTHSCFLFSYNYDTWHNCKRYCSGHVSGGVDGRDKGHHAIILDKETDSFVKDKINGRTKYWLGLTDSVEAGNYKWNDIKGLIVPRYYGWKNGESPRDSSKRYVIIESTGWKVYYQNWKAYCLCQVAAVVSPVKISSPYALQVGSIGYNAVNCSFTDGWDELSWYLPRSTEVVRCRKDLDGTSKCTSHIDGYSAVSTLNTGSYIKISKVQRYDEGAWKCVFKCDGQTIGEGIQELKVYETATEIDCEHSLTPTELSVTCSTPKIYPPAQCQWDYKYQNEDYKKFTNANHETSIYKTSYTDVNRAKFWNSSCTIILKKSAFEFGVGIMILRVAMDAKVEDRIATNSSVDKEHVVTIEAPNIPKFKWINGTRLGNSVTLTARDVITLTCFVYQGKPRVEKTYLKCDFYFDVLTKDRPHKAVSETRSGMSVKMKFNVIETMEGKISTCSGEHLTGRIESTEVLFHIESEASILRFSPNNLFDRNDGEVYTFTEGARIDLVCIFGGKPPPIVTIRRVDFNKMAITSQTIDTIKHRLVAKCTDNGEYQCQATNIVAGNVTEVSRSLKLSVSCSPTPCTENDYNKTYGANIGSPARIRLCLYANPNPRIDLFHLYHDKKQVMTDDYTLKYVSRPHAMGELSIEFFKVEDNIGEYLVVYNNHHKIASFNVVLKGAPFCPDETKVIERGRHHVRIEWVPGTSHEIGEIFVVFNLKDSPPYEEELAYIVANETTREGKVTFDLSGLEIGTTYNMSIGTKNDHGTRVCEKNWFNATTRESNEVTQANVDDGSSGSVTVIVVIVVIIVIILILVVVAFVLWRRKRQRKLHDTSVVSVRMKLAGGDVNVQENEDDGRDVYAKVNKPSLRTRQQNDNNLDNFRDNSDGVHSDQNVYNNDMQPIWDSGAVYANTSGFSNDACEEDDGPYKKKEKNRELVYTTVTIDSSKRCNLVEDDDVPVNSKEKPVEYASIDITATKLKEFKLKEEEDEEKRKKMEGGDDDDGGGDDDDGGGGGGGNDDEEKKSEHDNVEYGNIGRDFGQVQNADNIGNEDGLENRDGPFTSL